MKILVDHTLTSYASPAIYSGFEAYQHNSQLMSTFDTFDKANPDLYIADSELLTDSVLKNISERPSLQVCVIIKNDGDNTRKYKDKFKEYFGNLHQWFSHYDFADLLEFSNSQYDAKYKSDLVCIDDHLNNMINEIVIPEKYIYRIISPNFVKHNNYCGAARSQIKKNVLKSSKICLTSGENFYNAILCDCYPIIPKSAEDVLNQIDKDHTKEIKQVKEFIHAGHHNFDALYNILMSANRESEAKIVKEKLKEIL